MKYSENFQEKAYKSYLFRNKCGLVTTVFIGIASIIGIILLIVDKVNYFWFYLLCAVSFLASIFGFIYCYKQLKEASYLEE